MSVSLHRVRPSDRIKLSVSKVTNDQYDRLHSDLHEIRKIGMYTPINEGVWFRDWGGG